MIKKQKILVTGGAGFIGSHLCERLVDCGYQVICLDNFNDYYDPRIKKDNIREMADRPNFTLIKGDILDKKLLEYVFSKDKISKIIHLAAMAGVRNSLSSPDVYVDVDVKGTVNLLEMARKHKVKQFIFASSSSVYGIGSRVPFSEKETSLVTISPYSASKLAAEVFCRTYSKIYKIPTTVLRFFTVFGPRQRPEMAIHKFVRTIKRGKAIPVYGFGRQARDYTFIDDIIEGIMLALKRTFDFEIFNLGNSRKINLKDMIAILGEKTNMKPKIKMLPNQLGDMSVTWADISKAKKMLGWQPRTSFKDGITIFLQWYEDKEGLLNSIKI